jgi:hypothetical protein
MEIKFFNDVQKDFFESNMKRVRVNDTYHRSFFYCLSLSSDLRECVNMLFDFEADSIKLDGLKKVMGWACGSDTRILRLAYNLWTNSILNKNQAIYYTPAELFCGCDEEILEGMFEAIRLKYTKR